MTCIVGALGKDGVYIGADSAGITGSNKFIRKDVKVFKIKDFVIGCTSSFRMIQLLRFSFKPPKIKKKQDTYEYMCTDFIDAVRSCFKAGGYIHIENSEETGGIFLVGYKNRLFKIESDFQVGELFDSYAAVGCGSDYALGTMFALQDTNMTIEEKIILALEAAEKFSAGVSRPFIIEKTKG